MTYQQFISITPKTLPNPNLGRINRKLQNNIFYIEIDRPQKFNGFTPFMFKEIAKAFTEYENENKALCAIVFGNGKHFCAGMDLTQTAKFLKKGDHSFIHPKEYIDPLSLIKPIRNKPLICAVHGITYTYGLELMLSSDVALASTNCRFAMLEVLRGLMMTGGGTIRFVERAGWGNAMKYLLTGLEFDSHEALKMNLVQEIVKKSDLLKRANEIAHLITKASPKAVREVIKNSRIALVNPKKAISQFNKIQYFFLPKFIC